MRNKRDVESPGTNKSNPAPGPETDYSPKTYTLRNQIIFFVKLLVIFGIIFFLLWLIER